MELQNLDIVELDFVRLISGQTIGIAQNQQFLNVSRYRKYIGKEQVVYPVLSSIKIRHAYSISRYLPNMF